MEDLTGKQFGSYQIVGPLGAGGMASVYKAYQPGIDRYVALKVLPQHFAKDPLFLKRFEQEAKVLGQLQHPHILPMHDYGQSEDYTYIVMPFIESGDLADVLREHQLPLTETARIISQVGDALDYAHQQGVVHRDIKPSNILIDKRGNCILTDFGIAKMVEGASDPLTLTGGVMGTPSYMSPEQGMGKPLDGRSDIYALGVILYQMVTGQVPFKAETPMAVMIKHINDPLQPPRQFDADISEGLERVILKSLAKHPNDRFATAGEMVTSLQAAIEAPDTLQIAPEHIHTTPSIPKIDTPKKQLKRLSSTPAKPAPIPAKSNDSASLLMVGATAFIVILGLAGLVAWLLLNPGEVSLPINQPVEAQAPGETDEQGEATESLEAGQSTPNAVLTLPPALTSTPVLPTPLSTQLPPPPTLQQAPSPPPAAAPTQEAPALPADAPAPPQFAFEACNGLSTGAVCELQAPTGRVNGSCFQFGQGLACIPEGGPPPRSQ